MALLRTIKDKFSYYHHLKLGTLVALDEENEMLLKNFARASKHKRQKNAPTIKVKAYKFIMDEEFESLKIDFSKTHTFVSSDLIKAK